VIDDQAFLAQCYGNHEDRERMLFDSLEKTRHGLCACVFDTTDRVQHMFWRYMESDPRDQRSDVIPELYARMDVLVGRVMKQIGDEALLMVVSDHGFKSFARCVNLNAWLHENGYLALKPGKKTWTGLAPVLTPWASTAFISISRDANATAFWKPA
jgi:predicted AlkP superfamily phosphohydrolase/phosphomutase